MLPRFGDVCLPLVVTTHVRSDSGGIDIYLCLLSRAFKLQAGASVGIGILYVEHGAIPAGALIIVHIRVNGVFRIEAVGQGDFLPEGNGFGLSCSGIGRITSQMLPISWRINSQCSVRRCLRSVGISACACNNRLLNNRLSRIRGAFMVCYKNDTYIRPAGYIYKSC